MKSLAPLALADPSTSKGFRRWVRSNVTHMLSSRVGKVATVLLAASVGHAWAIGPSFDCSKASTPLPQFICASPDLSRTDLEFAQAYYAWRQQVGPGGSQALKLEAVDFQNRVAQQCGIAPSGNLPADPVTLAACLKRGYENQRSKWLSLLSGAAAEEARRPIDQHVTLQRDLQALGFLPPTEAIDGVYGATTRSAILAWQRSKGLQEGGFLGTRDAGALVTQAANSAPPGSSRTGTETLPAERERAASENSQSDWILPETAYKVDQSVSSRCTSTPIKSRSVALPGGVEEAVTATLTRIGSYRCNVALTIRSSRGTLLYQSPHWYGYEFGQEKGTGRTLSIALITSNGRPVVVIGEVFWPESGSCASCGPTTTLTFIVLRDGQSPTVTRFDSKRDRYGDLDYAVAADRIQIREVESLGCHACGVATTTPYWVNLTTQTLEKAGDTVIDDPELAKQADTGIVNYHLRSRPVWGPWWLSDSGCSLYAVTDTGVQIGFGLAGPSLALTMGQTFPDDMAPWRKKPIDAPRTKDLEHDGALPSRITAYIDGSHGEINFSAGNILPNGMMGATMVLFTTEASPLTAVTNAMALQGNHLVLDLMWGTDEWGNHATFHRLISMDISGGKNAVQQLVYCAR
jgi:Putative peptidoglycan binding domain